MEHPLTKKDIKELNARMGDAYPAFM